MAKLFGLKWNLVCQIFQQYIVKVAREEVENNGITAMAPRLHTVTNKPYVNEVTLNEQN